MSMLPSLSSTASMPRPFGWRLEALLAGAQGGAEGEDLERVVDQAGDVGLRTSRPPLVLEKVSGRRSRSGRASRKPWAAAEKLPAHGPPSV
jgi:hypothetical protein